MGTPRQFSLVRYDFGADAAEEYPGYPFKRNGVYVFFGEIPNMPGHCVVADHESGRIYTGYHTENFIELTEDET